MKKLVLFAICAMTVMVGCKNKGQTAPADENDSTTVGDSILGQQQDTTPLPMFLYIQDKDHMQMVYWTQVAEPKKDQDNAEYFKEMHDSWALQDMLRRHAKQYTTLVAGGRNITIKYVDEILKNPDGEEMYGGELHGFKEIPSPGARFAFATPSEYSQKFNGMNVIVHEQYVKSRQQLGVKNMQNGGVKKMPQAVISKLEKKYGMKVERSVMACQIGENYVFGSVQFQGEWKNAPKLPGEDNADLKKALALEVVAHGDSVYSVEKVGAYYASEGPTWNADDGGEYGPSYILAAFEGPQGLELCYEHDAPESVTVGMLLLRDGKLIEKMYECYHSMYEEELPVWKKDFAEMRKLYQQKTHKDVAFTKWAHVFIGQNEWIRLHDSTDQNGAFFIRQDGEIRLVAVETPDSHATTIDMGQVNYLRLTGSAADTSIYTEIFGFKDGQLVEHFTMKESFGDIEECTFNGKPYSKEQGGAYADRLSQAKEIPTSWRDIEEDKEGE